MANKTLSTTSATSQLLVSSPQSSRLAPTLQDMPSEIKRQIARALIDPPLSRAAEALEIVDWIDLQTSPGGCYRESWINQPAGDRENAAKTLQQRLGSLARVNKEFELIAAELASKYYIMPFSLRQEIDARREWRWEYYILSQPLAPRLGAFVHSIIIRTIHATPSQRAFIAALVPHLYNLDDVDMDIPDENHRDADLLAIVAIARVAKQIRRLRLSLAWLRHRVCLCKEMNPGDDSGFTGDSSEWLAAFLKDFLNLTILEVEEVDGDRAAHIALAKTLAGLRNLDFLRIRGRNGFPPPEIAFIPFSAPLRTLWVAQIPNLRAPLPYSDLDGMVPWLANFSSTLETFVWKEGSPMRNAPPPRNGLQVLPLPHLTTLWLARYDTDEILGIFADAPLHTVVFNPGGPSQALKDFMIAHPRLERVFCRHFGRFDQGTQATKALCAERSQTITFKSCHDEMRDDPYDV